MGMHHVRVVNYLRNTYDLAQETDSQVGLKNCSENVEGRSLLHDFSEGGNLQSSTIFWQRLAASHTEHVSSLMILPFSRYKEM